MLSSHFAPLSPTSYPARPALANQSRARHVLKNGLGGRARIGGGNDRARHDQMAGAGLERLCRAHHPFLVARRCAGGADAGGDDGQVGAQDRAGGLASKAEATIPPMPDIARLAGAQRHEADTVMA